MNSKTLLILLAVGLILSTVLLAPHSGERSEGCVSCHSGWEIFPVRLQGPAEMPVDEEFEVSVVVSNPEDNGDPDDNDDDGFPYEVKDIEAELNLSGAPNVEIVGDNLTLSAPDLKPGESTTLIWHLRALSPGEANITASVKGTAYHKHNSNNPDSYDYTVGPLELTIMVKALPVRLSSYHISANAGENRSFEVILTTNESISNLTFTPSPEISPYLNLSVINGTLLNGTLEKGGWIIFRLALNSPKEIHGSLLFSWVNSTNTRQNLTLSVDIISRQSFDTGGINWLSLSGRISGIAIIVLLGVSIVLGGFPPQIKKYLKKLGKKRIDLHCQVSYLIIGVTIFHAAVLLVGPWGHRLLHPQMIMGYISTALMIFLGIHGAMPVKFTNTPLGGKKWRSTHKLITIGVLVTGLIHGIMLGTDLAFLRELLRGLR